MKFDKESLEKEATVHADKSLTHAEWLAAMFNIHGNLFCSVSLKEEK
jgi:hypothetical protein